MPYGCVLIEVFVGEKKEKKRNIATKLKHKIHAHTREEKAMKLVNFVWDDTNKIGAYETAENSNEFTISYLPCCMPITHSEHKTC